MAKDFTVGIYKEFLEAFINAGYELTSFENYLEGQTGKVMILRHDVDKRPGNSLEIARLQSKLGLKGTYYFRAVPQSFNEEIIKEIVGLGHEIGYHYEDLALKKGNSKKAIEHFEKWLDIYRKYYPVKTICMHGSPLSPYDNRRLWEDYDYRDYGIIGEPYFDLDFNRFLYLTDTGRRWDGGNVSVRDKVNSGFQFKFRSTPDIIEALHQNQLPDKIMQNIHPQRWTDKELLWWKEFVFQNLKNVIKKNMITRKKHGL